MHHQLTQSRIFKIPKGVRITSKLILKSFSMRTLVVIALAFYVLEYSFWSWHCCSIGGYHKTGTTGTDKVTQRRRRTTAVKRKLSRFTSTTSRQESSSSACCLAITSQAAQQLNHRRFFSSLLGSQRSWDSIFSSTRSLGSTLTTVEVNRLLLSHLSSLKMTLTTRWDVDDVMLSRWASVDSRWRLLLCSHSWLPFALCKASKRHLPRRGAAWSLSVGLFAMRERSVD